MTSRTGRALVLCGLAAAVAGLAAIGAAAWSAVARAPAPREPTPLELRAAIWRGALGTAGLAGAGSADAEVAAGRAALYADLPASDVEALRHFTVAAVLDPGRLDALAGYLDAFAAAAGDDPDGEELREAHRLARWGMERAPGRPDLMVGWARLLLLVPGEANLAEALASVKRAEASGGGAEALLAEAEARLAGDPAASAEAAMKALAAAPADRRPLLVAARARWAPGDARAALELAERRLSIHPGHGGALALVAHIQVASGRTDAARQALRRWVAAAPGSPEPLLEQALLAYQVDGDLAEGRRLLARARALPGDDFLAARILAHAAAVERAAGNAVAARRFVDQALARVPASGPARFQEALLDFTKGDAAAHRQAAGVVGQRAGARAARLLEARTLELAGRLDEAIAAWESIAADSARDLELQLLAAGAFARMRAPGRAVPVLARAGELDLATARSRRHLGDYWEGPPALATAAREIESMTGEGPIAAQALTGAATCELLLGHPQLAESLVRRAIDLAPQLGRAHAIAAQIALDRGRGAEALRESALAMEVEPRNASVLELRARIFEAGGRPADFAQAAETRRRALQIDPKAPGARLGEARRLLREGQRDKGIAALRQLVAEDPEQVAARGALLEAASAK